MSLAGELIRRAGDAAEDLTEDGIQVGAAKARELAHAHLSAGDRAAADDLLDELVARRGQLAVAAKSEVVGALALLGVGARDEARRAWLAGGATFLERRAASAGSTAATSAATEARTAALQALEEIAAKVGALAVRVAVPLLLAAL